MNRKNISKFVDHLFEILIVMIVLITSAGLIFEVVYLGRVYPGLRVGSIDAGGMTFAQLRLRLIQEEETIRIIRLDWGVNQWSLDADKIALKLDSNLTASKMLAFGRSGNIGADIRQKMRLLGGEVVIPPKVIVDRQKLGEEIRQVADQIDIPAREPEIAIESGNVQISAGENGLKTDTDLLATRLFEKFSLLVSPRVTIPVAEIRPKLSEAQITSVRDLAMLMVGKKMTVTSDEETWEVGQDQLVSWIDMRTGGWDEGKIYNWIEEMAIAVDRPAQNATFHYVGKGKVEEFKPARAGVKLEKNKSVEKIVSDLETFRSPDTTEVKVALITESVSPEIETGEVNSLGIKELIGRGESWYSGSITNRIFNLKKAAESINGILIAPEEIFSFNKVVGEISASTGYKQAYIIKEGKTILGDGGGVCQVSSTLFRAVLAAGLPIEERIAHAYRVHYYEERYQPGFDATVFQPSPDFRFKNDTDKYILIQAVYDEKEKYLAFEIYGTSDGRKVEISKSRIWEVTAPPPESYQDDPTLPMGKVVQTEHAAWGAKVAFDWKVVRDGEILQERTFYSNYKPWQAVYLRGTKPI